LQPRGFSQHGGASRNSRAWLRLIWTTVLLPPLDFQKVRATPDFKKINLKGRVVVWLFRAECAAANAPIAEATLREIPKAARGLGLQISVLNASTPREIEAAFATLVRDRADALFVMPDALFISRRVQFAARHGIPTAYSVRESTAITATCLRTRSLANSNIRSSRPPAQRNSIATLRPSTQRARSITRSAFFEARRGRAGP
jgi:hypothetical protein